MAARDLQLSGKSRGYFKKTKYPEKFTCSENTSCARTPEFL